MKNVRLREVIACAAALGVAPINLLSPIDENDGPSVTWGRGELRPGVYRDWLVGLNVERVSPDPSDGALYHSFQPARVLNELRKRAPNVKVAGLDPPLPVRVAQMPEDARREAWAAGTSSTTRSTGRGREAMKGHTRKRGKTWSIVFDEAGTKMAVAFSGGRAGSRRRRRPTRRSGSRSNASTRTTTSRP